MEHADYFLLVMTLSEGFYGEYGNVYDIHELGYSELCEEFSEKSKVPWFNKTHGVLFCDERITLVDITENGDFICKITEEDMGIIPKSQMHWSNRFGEALLDSFTTRTVLVDNTLENNGEIDISILRNTLVESPLVLDKPFDCCGYFEKKSTIEASKENLKNNI